MADAKITKKPGETLLLGFRFHSPTLGDGETIIALSVSAQTGITAGTSQISGNDVYAPISGGTTGSDYVITYTASTDQGQVFVKEYLVKVRS